jgi:hypothetical protein
MASNGMFYFKLWDGRKTTTGEPNKRTGRMSIAHTFVFVINGKKPPKGYSKIDRKELRKLNNGLTLLEFNERCGQAIWWGYNENNN